MTFSTIFKLYTYLKVNCLHVTTHKLYAHDTLTIDKNICDLFAHLKTDALENVHHNTRLILTTAPLESVRCIMP